MGRKSRTLRERFWSMVEKTEGCWNWTGSKTRNGYGQINDGGKPWTMLAAHRVSWEIHRGAVADGLYVLHKCDNPACVRPDHLFLGNHAENMADMTDKGRASRGSARWNAKLTREKVRAIRARYQPGNARQLAAEFGVSEVQIGRIVKRSSWRWLKESRAPYDLTSTRP